MLKYIVQPGDSIYFISLKFKIPVPILLQVNNISSPNDIYPGQIIQIPLPGSDWENGQDLPILTRRSSGPFVMLLQNQLLQLGYYPGAIDGILGILTEESVIQFQRSSSLPASGIVDRQTWEKLMKEARALSQTPPFRAKMTPSGLLMVFSVNGNSFSAGERVFFSLVKVNMSLQALTLNYFTGQRYDFKITYPSGLPLWRWSESMSFVQVLGSITLAPGKMVRYTAHFDIPPHQASGLYQVYGWNSSKELQDLKLVIPIHIVKQG